MGEDFSFVNEIAETVISPAEAGKQLAEYFKRLETMEGKLWRF